MITLLIAPVALRIAWVKNMRELAVLILYAATLYIHLFSSTYSAETTQVFTQTSLAHFTADFTKKFFRKMHFEQLMYEYTRTRRIGFVSPIDLRFILI
jgi:hypothetical protein